jgi:hypothetical protein
VKKLLVLLLVVACGGAKPVAETPKAQREESAEEKRSREYHALIDAETKFPWVVEQTKAFKVASECGQGPYRVEGKILGGSAVAEKVEVYICASHRLSGRERFVMSSDRNDDGQHFGYSQPENERCSASATELTHAGDAGATSSTSAATSTPKSTGVHGVTAQAAPEKLSDASFVIAATDECPKGTSKLTVTESTSRSGALYGPFHVDVWFPEPNDLRDATFVLRQYRSDPAITRAQWDKLEADHDDWYRRLDAFQKSHDDMFVHEDTHAAAVPPPPARVETQPPKPSVHATWVPGYHHHDGAAWVWIAGFWRVPDEDVKQELTTVAPTAPPPVRDESAARVAVVAHDVVWTDGHWQWDGARWVWVDGAWRLPPDRGVAWQAPAWRPRGATFVFVPGGWARRR